MQIIEDLPYGLALCTANGETATLTGLSDRQLRLRTYDAQPLFSLSVRFLAGDLASYRDCPLDGWTVSCEEHTRLGVLRTVDISCPAFAEEARRVLRLYAGYLRLKALGDDEYLAHALTGCPYAETTARSFVEQRAAWLRGAGAFSLPGDWTLALTADNFTAYERFLSLSLDAFQRQATAGLPVFARPAGRIYIGNACCPRLFPDRPLLSALLARAKEQGLSVTIVLPPVSENAVSETERLLACLDATDADELCVNDLGALALTRQSRLTPILGIQLNRRRKDPRLRYKTDWREALTSAEGTADSHGCQTIFRSDDEADAREALTSAKGTADSHGCQTIFHSDDEAGWREAPASADGLADSHGCRPVFRSDDEADTREALTSAKGTADSHGCRPVFRSDDEAGSREALTSAKGTADTHGCQTVFRSDDEAGSREALTSAEGTADSHGCQTVFRSDDEADTREALTSAKGTADSHGCQTIFHSDDKAGSREAPASADGLADSHGCRPIFRSDDEIGSREAPASADGLADSHGCRPVFRSDDEAGSREALTSAKGTADSHGCQTIFHSDDEADTREALTSAKGTADSHGCRPVFRSDDKADTREALPLFSRSSLDDPGFREWLAGLGVTRFEYESCGYAPSIAPGRHSLHLPFYQTNTSHACPLAADCLGLDPGQEVPDCRHICETRARLYPDEMHMLGRYNSLFAFDPGVLAGPAPLSHLLAAGIDRLVVNLLSL